MTFWDLANAHPFLTAFAVVSVAVCAMMGWTPLVTVKTTVIERSPRWDDQ